MAEKRPVRVTTKTSVSLAVVAVLWLPGQFAPSARAATEFTATLDRFQVVNNVSESTATGAATFTLRDTSIGPQLDYTLTLEGLDLVLLPANRTEPNDVVGIHLHLHVPDVIGPHILNIFGNPGEDDADLVVDYENESLSGTYDLADASRDAATGELLPQAFPLTTKLIDNWIDELMDGRLYIAVHSRERAMNAPPGVDIRGNIVPVPEPAAAGVAVLGWAISAAAGRNARLRRSIDVY